MQDGEQHSENWQQPHESSSAVPYTQQVPAEPIEPQQQMSTSAPAEPSVSIQQPLVEQPAPTSSAVSQPAITDDEALLRWTGTEYLHQERSAIFFVVIGIVAVLLTLLAIFLLHSYTFAFLVPVMAIALVVYVRRPPETLQYVLSHKGLHIGEKLFTYDQFKAFGVVSHGNQHSVVLVPRKRFQIAQSIYFPEEIGEKLVDFLAARLPMKEITPDVVDRFLARLHL